MESISKAPHEARSSLQQRESGSFPGLASLDPGLFANYSPFLLENQEGCGALSKAAGIREEEKIVWLEASNETLDIPPVLPLKFVLLL